MGANVDTAYPVPDPLPPHVYVVVPLTSDHVVEYVVLLATNAIERVLPEQAEADASTSEIDIVVNS